MVRETLEGDEETSKITPPWVFFDGFNEWSLNIRILAWFTPKNGEPDQERYFAWRERNCRMILRRFAEEEVQFAFPTGTTYLANDEKRQLKLVTLQHEGFSREVEGRGPSNSSVFGSS